jgi:hypothetical protein
METMPNGAGERPELYDVPRDLADESESELAEKDLQAEPSIENVTKREEPQRIIVPFSEEDIQDLMHGEELCWVFALNDGSGKQVELLLRKETEEDYMV